MSTSFDLAAFLQSVSRDDPKLSFVRSYHNLFQAFGFDSLMVLSKAEVLDLEYIGVKTGHAMLIIKAARQLLGNSHPLHYEYGTDESYDSCSDATCCSSSPPPYQDVVSSQGSQEGVFSPVVLRPLCRSLFEDRCASGGKCGKEHLCVLDANKASFSSKSEDLVPSCPDGLNCRRIHLCTPHLKGKECKHGDDCWFAHIRACKFFLTRRSCKYGALNCHHPHTLPKELNVWKRV